MPEQSIVYTEESTPGHADRQLVEGMSVRVPRGRITVVVGPNAAGKSMLLRGIARLLSPSPGAAYLDCRSIHTLTGKEFAAASGIRSPSAPERITVAELIGRGRSAPQGFRRCADDAGTAAMRVTDTLELADCPIDELSGGQRQRAWIAMALARRTGVLLLDEPTIFLDVTRQVGILDLLAELNRTEGTTIVLVLNDLNLASRYGDHLLVLKDGGLVAEGAPATVITEQLVRAVFDLPCRVIDDPVSATPLVVPFGRRDASVSTEDELREVIAQPAPAIRDKPVAGIDEDSRRFLEASPFFLLATSGQDGTVDVSPRGDPAGYVLVLDDGRSLAFADRDGNRRVDSMRNVLRNPDVGLLFIVPGVEHTLRINGRARIVRDGPLPERFAVNGTPPELAIVVEVDELFVHCGRAFARSSLWDPRTWPDRADLPTSGTLFKSQGRLRDALGD